MKKVFLLSAFVLSAACAFSQNIGINTTGAAANLAALLDVGTAAGGDTKGMLIPRVALTALGTWLPLTPAGGVDGLIIYNTNNAVGNGRGFYYWSTAAASWINLIDNQTPFGYIQDQFAGAQAGANHWISGSSRATEVYAANWFRNDAINTGLYNQTTGAGIWSTAAGLMSTYNGASFQIDGASNASGNLRFVAPNPYIVASSYFIAPGGAYFNSGTVYTEAAIQVRGGINNDAGNFGGDVQVNENLRFVGALMPAGNAGVAGSFLRSAGAGVPPTWTAGGVNVASVNTVESTGNLCINNTGVWGAYPGCSAVLSLVVGQRVCAWAEAGIMVDDNCDGLSDASRLVVDARISVNGADFANGAWLRTSLDNATGWVMFTPITLIGEYTCTAAGAYTFTMEARRNGGGAGDNGISGGNTLSSLQATMVLIVYTP